MKKIICGLSWRLLRIVILLLVGHTSIELLCNQVQSTFIHHAITNEKRWHFGCFRKSIRDFSRFNTGYYIYVLINNVNTGEENHLNRLFGLISKPPTFLAMLIKMLYYSPFLTLISAALCVLPFASEILVNLGLSKRKRHVGHENAKFISKLSDLFTGISVIKVLS